VVNSTWRDWHDNYPNLTGETDEINYKSWVPEGKEYLAGRYHHRWWFYLMPHVSGATDDGYSNNWWNYFVSLDFVQEIIPKTSKLEIKAGQELAGLEFEITYKSLDKENITVTAEDNSLHIADRNIVDIKAGKFVGKNIGSTLITYYADGKSAQTEIVVKEASDSMNSDSVTVIEVIRDKARYCLYWWYWLSEVKQAK